VKGVKRAANGSCIHLSLWKIFSWNSTECSEIISQQRISLESVINYLQTQVSTLREGYIIYINLYEHSMYKFIRSITSGDTDLQHNYCRKSSHSLKELSI